MFDAAVIYEKMKKFGIPVLICFLVVFILLNSRISPIVSSAGSPYPHLTSQEWDVLSQINGTNVYNYDLNIENITLDPTISGYSFRSAGSPGANETAKWIQQEFESFGLETHNESFLFTSWSLPTKPTLVIDGDGNASTLDDRKIVTSFVATHYSLPTPVNGTFRSLVTLPLPPANSRASVINGRGYDAATWSTTDITGKILLIGREVRWNSHMQTIFVNKLRQQPPAAVIYTWSYDWMSSFPPYFLSADGLPASDFGRFYWDLGIPVGWVNYDDGLWMRNMLSNNTNLSANMTINAIIDTSPQYNVIGKLTGSTNPEKTIIISAHYDSVADAGFCDNGAGTAGIIELARVFTDAARKGIYTPGCTLLFIAFTSEELGLIGSTNYIKQHEAEIKDIQAVIDLDSIGADNFEFSETFTDDGIDLNQIVTNAATDLNIHANMTETGGSDEESFRSPMVSDYYYRLFWGTDLGISNVTRVLPSTMIASYPLFYSDQWNIGAPGWIHTPYDNSTSTATLGWVQPDNLEGQVRIAGLTVMRVLSEIYSPFFEQLVSVSAAVCIFAAIAIYFQRNRMSVFLKEAYHDILYNIGPREFIYIVILSGIFLFVFFALHTRPSRTELIVQGFPTTIQTLNFGFPFEMFQVLYDVQGSTSMGDTGDGTPSFAPGYSGGVRILWYGLIPNVILSVIMAFSLMFLITKWKYEISLRKMLSQAH
jgi:hypothetical protein